MDRDERVVGAGQVDEVGPVGVGVQRGVHGREEVEHHGDATVRDDLRRQEADVVLVARRALEEDGLRVAALPQRDLLVEVDDVDVVLVVHGVQQAREERERGLGDLQEVGDGDGRGAHTRGDQQHQQQHQQHARRERLRGAGGPIHEGRRAGLARGGARRGAGEGTRMAAGRALVLICAGGGGAVKGDRGQRRALLARRLCARRVTCVCRQEGQSCNVVHVCGQRGPLYGTHGAGRPRNPIIAPGRHGRAAAAASGLPRGRWKKQPLPPPDWLRTSSPAHVCAAPRTAGLA